MPLPSQNQLYGYYVARCGHYGVRKPHSAVVRLLAEDVDCHETRLSSEAAERGVEVAALVLIEDDGNTEEMSRCRASVAPLAHLRTFRLEDPVVTSSPSHLYIGARGMLPILDLVAELPLLQQIDFSNVASWFDGDAFAGMKRGGVPGNKVVDHLCCILPRLPYLRSIRLDGQALGSVAAARLLDAIQPLSTIVDLQFDASAVDAALMLAFDQTLDTHRHIHTELTKPFLTARRHVIPAAVASLPLLDRKTVREQQILHALLREDPNFEGVLSEEDMARMVLTARVMSTTEILFHCGDNGIRGDGEHLFILKSGVVRVYADLEGFVLSRGDYFGDVYSAVLVPCARLVEEERGVVYAIPLRSCSTLLEHWGTRLATAWPWLHRTPMLQPVGAWSCMRACCCSSFRTWEPMDTVVEVGDGAAALHLVCDGVFAALDASTADTARFSERNVRTVFSRFDVFGVEAFVARKHQSSVRIKAAKEKGMLYRTLQVSGCGARVLCRQLHAVFASLTRDYSLHEDLCAGYRKDYAVLPLPHPLLS